MLAGWKLFLALPIVVCFALPAAGDRWAPPRPGVFASKDGKYWVRTTLNDVKSASATLSTYDWEVHAERRTLTQEFKERIVWQQDLGYIPARLLVSRWGTVVGVDRYGRLGYEHTLVIWDPAGKKVADFNLEDLLTRDEIRTFTEFTATSRPWDHDARFDFPDESRLTVELEWGKLITINVLTGERTFLRPASALPEPMSGFEDDAVFVFFKEGRRMCEMGCAWRADGSVRCEGAAIYIDAPGPYALTVTPDADGRWERVTVQARGGPTGIVRDGTLVQRMDAGDDRRGRARSNGGGRQSKDVLQRSLKPRSVCLDYIDAPILWSQLIRLYDRRAGGPQPFHLIQPNMQASEGTVRFLDTQSRLIDGQEMAFDRYAMGGKIIWADRDARVYLIEQRDSVYDIYCVRKGYEVLRE